MVTFRSGSATRMTHNEHNTSAIHPMSDFSPTCMACRPVFYFTVQESNWKIEKLVHLKHLSKQLGTSSLMKEFLLTSP